MANDSHFCKMKDHVEVERQHSLRSESEHGKEKSSSSITSNDRNMNEIDSDYNNGSYWGWVIVFTSFFTQFIAEGITYTFGVILVDISKEFQSDGKGAVAWIASILVGQYHIVGPLGSVLINKYGARNVSIVGSLIGAAGYALSYFAQSVYILYLTIGVISGTGLSLLYLPAMVSVPQYFEKRRALAFGISVCGSGVGTLFFEWVTCLMLPQLGWRVTIVVLAGMILSAIPVSFLYKNRQANKKSQVSTDEMKKFEVNGVNQISTENIAVAFESELKGSSNEIKKGKKKIFNLNLLKDRVFLLFAICDIFMGLGYSTPFLYLPDIEQKMSGEPKSSILGIIGITNIAGRALTGFVGDFKWFNKHIVYSCTLLFCGLLTIGSPWLPTLLSLRMYAAIYGTLMGSYMTLKSVNLVEILGLDKLTDAFGMLLLFQAIGFIVGPPIVGVMFDSVGTYHPGFVFAGVSIVLGGILLFFIPIVQKSVQKSSQK